jgi:hypothetical protein
MRYGIVTALLVLSAATACQWQPDDAVSTTEEALTSPVAGAVAKPSSFTIVPPWGNGVSHTLWQTYGTNLHRNTNSTGGSNDYYALDINLALNEAVYPIAAGTVTYAGPALGGWASYGNIVFLNHVVGGVSYQSLYAHLASVAVTSGSSVTTSTLIGRAGNSGTSAVHLHLAVYKGASFYNTSTARGPYGGNAVVPEAFSSCTKNGGSCENLAVNNVLTKTSSSLPACGSGLYCAVNSVPGASQCMSGSQPLFCCPSGQQIINGVCTSPSLPACGSGLFCAVNSIPGASQCMSGSQPLYCCPSGQTIVNGVCTPSAPPACGSGLFCAGNSIPGSSACMSGSQLVYCCAPGKTIVNGACSP